MDEVCRLCLSKSFVSEDIFGDEGIYEEINACLPVKISESDGLPQKVCKPCVLKVRDIYSYCQRTVSVQKQLILGNSIPTDESLYESTSHFSIKEEPPEGITEHLNNGVIVFKKIVQCSANLTKNTNYSTKYTQTDVETIKIDNLIQEFDLLNNECDEKDLKVKIEDDSADELHPELDRSYSSDDDLALSCMIKSSETKGDQRELGKLENGKKKTLISKKKSIVVGEKRKRGRPKKPPQEKIGPVVVKQKESNRTPDDMKQWQCLMCFVHLGSRGDLLQHYKDHVFDPTKILAAQDNQNEDADKPDNVDTKENAGPVKKMKQKRKGTLGVDFVSVDNSEFGNKPAYQCVKCLKICPCKTSMRRHLISHDDTRKFACSICGRAYKSAYEILLHGRVHNAFKNLKCKYPECKYTTVYRGALHNHIKRHEGTMNHKFICEVCHKGFDILSWFNEHKNVHLGIKPFTCDVCGKGFVYARYLQAHRKCVHPEAIDDGKQMLHRCRICSKQFSHRRHLRSHMNREHPVKKTPEEMMMSAVLCDICGKALTSKEHLKFHRRTHTGEKPYVCRTCGKGFVKKCNLTLHERVHSGEKPHVCSHCGKAFSQRSTLVIHERYHSGARPYVCGVCNKGFVARGLLSMHQKTCL